LAVSNKNDKDQKREGKKAKDQAKRVRMCV